LLRHRSWRAYRRSSQERRASPSCPVAGAATLLVPTPFLPCTIGATMHLFLLQHDSTALATDLAQFLLAKPTQERLAAVAGPASAVLACSAAMAGRTLVKWGCDLTITPRLSRSVARGPPSTACPPPHPQ